MQNDNRNIIVLKTPASWHGDMWREGLPTGNGIIGALVYGNIADETIIINHCNLWHWGKKSELPDISYTLAETRRLMDQGNFYEANWVSTNALREKGYTAKLASPCPLCDIKVSMAATGIFKNYRRILNMETGEVIVSWHSGNCKFTRKLFVSRADDMLVYKIDSNQNNIEVDIYIQLHETYDKDTERKRKEVEDSIQIYVDNNYIYYAVKNDDGWDFGAVMKVICEDGEFYTKDTHKISVRGASSVTAYCYFFVNSSRDIEFKNLRKRLEEHNEKYESYLKRHIKLHRTLFTSVDINIAYDKLDMSNEELLLNSYENIASNALIEKMWRFGRYLMICGTAKDGLPFPLYGLWGGKYNLPWSHNMANENIQMIYWHTLVGGLEDTMESFIDYYFGLMEDFRINAKRLFDCSGIYIPAGTTPGMGLPNQVVPVILNWIGAAGWLSQHFYKYYKFTGNLKLLKEKILPFMYEAAQFYLDYIVKDENGYYKIYPSVSPENTPQNLMPDEECEHMSHPCPSVINATMDFAIIKELLYNIIEASRITGMYKNKIKDWENVLKSIPPYQKNPEGDIKEWMHPGLTDRYNHRHLSHIYPVFPGDEYVVGRDDESILAAFELAVDKRILNSQSGWSLAHMACIYARLERAEKAIECIDILIKSCVLKNLFTLHNDWRKMGLTLDKGEFAPIQLDANMGFVNAIQEMLLFVSDDIIKILPACPERFRKGMVKNLRIMTGFISFKWDKDKMFFRCVIEAVHNTNLKIQLPKFANKYVINGRYIYGNVVNISLDEGEKLFIDCIGK